MDEATLFCAILVAVVVLAVGWLVNVLVFQPMRVVQELRRQGVPGPPFRPLLGQMPEMRAVSQEDIDLPMLRSISYHHVHTFIYCSLICLDCSSAIVEKQILNLQPYHLQCHTAKKCYSDTDRWFPSASVLYLLSWP